MKKTNKTVAKATKKTAKAKVIKAVEVKKVIEDTKTPAKKVTLKSITIQTVPELLKKSKTGMKYSEIIKAVQVLKPTATRNSIHGCLYGLKLNEWKGILIAEKGKYIYKVSAKKS